MYYNVEKQKNIKKNFYVYTFALQFEIFKKTSRVILQKNKVAGFFLLAFLNLSLVRHLKNKKKNLNDATRVYSLGHLMHTRIAFPV